MKWNRNVRGDDGGDGECYYIVDGMLWIAVSNLQRDDVPAAMQTLTSLDEQERMVSHLTKSLEGILAREQWDSSMSELMDVDLPHMGSLRFKIRVLSDCISIFSVIGADMQDAILMRLLVDCRNEVNTTLTAINECDLMDRRSQYCLGASLSHLTRVIGLVGTVTRISRSVHTLWYVCLSDSVLTIRLKELVQLTGDDVKKAQHTVETLLMNDLTRNGFRDRLSKFVLNVCERNVGMSCMVMVVMHSQCER